MGVGERKSYGKVNVSTALHHFRKVRVNALDLRNDGDRHLWAPRGVSRDQTGQGCLGTGRGVGKGT